MRIKSDFITNSSSTSFIIRDMSPIKIAKEMLKCIIEDDTYDIHDKDDLAKFYEDNNLYEKFKYLEGLDHRPNIYFPWGCNETTYIYAEPPPFDLVRGFKIDTNRNTDWRNLDTQEPLGEDAAYDYTDTDMFYDLGMVMPLKPMSRIHIRVKEGLNYWSDVQMKEYEPNWDGEKPWLK